MLSKEQLDIYQQMTPGQKLELTFETLEHRFPYPLHGPRKVLDRRFELLNRQNDDRNRNMLEGLTRA